MYKFSRKVHAMNSGSVHSCESCRELSVEQSTKCLFESLEADGFAVIDGWLTPAEADAIRVETLASHGRGEFTEARIGRSGETQRLSEIRSDVTRWWDPAAPTPAQQPLVERIERLRLALNRRFFLGLRDWEGHSAVYAEGSFYRRHLDRFRSDDRRTISLVAYFNPDWRPGDGGELRVWRDEHDPRPLEVEPLSGRAVLFLSDRIPHEVLRANRPRISFAGWFRRA